MRAGGVVRVEPKVLDLLVHLIRCRERLVEKAELFARVWTDTYVSDASLMQCVRRARVAIGDTGGERAAIRTVRGRGYTFVAPVTVDAGLRAENEASSESPTEPGGGPDLFGRAAEIAAADEWLAATAAGSGGLLLIPGEAGVGKSMLAHRIAELAQARNFAVLWANGGTRLGSPPYWVWSQVLNAFAEAVEPPVLRHSLGVGAADLAELAPGLRQRLGELREAPVVDAEQLRARLLQAFLDWLRQASRRQPLLVVFDDVHLADRSSLMVLELAVQDAQSLSLGFVATCRVPDVDATRDAAATIDRLRVAGRCREIELVGWSEAQLADVAAAHLGDVPGADVAALWRRTQGVPFFVVELLRGARTAADLAGSAREVEVEGSVPTAVRALVRERLTSLTSDTRSFLEVAAVVGLDIVPEFVAALSGLDRGAVTAAMDEAEAHRMVVADAGYRFAHALFAEVLYSELPTFRRAQWHRAVAEEYGRVGREPAARAYHLTRANGCVDASVVVRALIDAGDEAAAKHAYDDALAHFEQALGRLDDSADADLQGQVLVKLTSSARYAGRILAARASGRRAATTALDLGDA